MSRRFDGDHLLVATHNLGKLEEIEALLRPFGVRVSSNADFGLPEPEETETTFAGNALIKARAGTAATGLPALADDSGIEVAALGGAPGVYTADWAEGPGGRDFTRAMTRTWTELQASGTEPPFAARFCCTLALTWPDGHHEVFAGEMPGQVVWPMRGAHGHGYDPIFQPEGYEVTFAEMAPEEKNRISHRADAFAKLVAGCFA